MKNKNIVFIAKSLDGFIAGKNGELEWLDKIPNPEKLNMGFDDLMTEIDAIVMGRKTFETVCSFGGKWVYSKPVFVLSNSIDKVPEVLQDKVSIIHGSISEILETIHNKDYHCLYIDGGRTIQSFLREDLIDELIISTLPILLGDGVPLFSILPKPLEFKHQRTEVFLDEIVQSHYQRKDKSIN